MRLDQKAALLNALPTFQVMQPEAVHVLAFSAQDRQLQAGEQLFKKGDPSDGGFVVASGRIALHPDGVTPLGAQSYEPGALIGEAALVAETLRPATAIAIEPSTVIVLPRRMVREVLEAHPASAARLRAHVAAQIREQQGALQALV